MIFFENILDELSAKIRVTDDNLDVLFLNKSAEDYLCTTLEESKGKNVDKVFKEKISNELELQEILEKKKSLKRHITTIFLKDNIKKYDVIIGMYHDQVLTPIKTIHEFDAINITLGLPFLRVSPDHGPNLSMFGRNKSNPLSLIRSIEFLNQ